MASDSSNLFPANLFLLANVCPAMKPTIKLSSFAHKTFSLYSTYLDDQCIAPLATVANAQQM